MAMQARRRARRPVEVEDYEVPEHEIVPLLMKWDAPDYVAILRKRMVALEEIRKYPERMPALRAYYKDHPADFINDWGTTFDPRNAEVGLPTYMPFILFPKQRDWIAWVIDRWKNRRPGLCEKSRDMGVSWLAMGLGCTLCNFWDGITIGVGSRKGEYVDKIGTHKPLLPKGRMFMEGLPREFQGGWEGWRDAPFMRISFPDTGSLIAGEGGDDIGRGDRTAIYFVDEYAHFERPALTEASLSQTTNCRIDMSSVRGMNNPFAQKRWGGKVDVFIFDWRDDPRKNPAWYAKQCEDLDPVVVAQEIDRDYQASVTGVVIPAAWAKACVGAKKFLGIAPSGMRAIALDVADEGLDKNAAAICEGTSVLLVPEWSGKGADIYQTVEKAFELCDENEIDLLEYDSDGLGAGVRGDARILNQNRRAAGKQEIRAVGFRGSGSVDDPDGIVEGTIGREGDKGRTKKDYFANAKAQGWWEVRRRARNTYRWVVEGIKCAPDDILDLDDENPDVMKLVAEMSQPTYATSPLGKITINKKPDGMKSPNRADAVMIRFAPKGPVPIKVGFDMVEAIRRAQQPGRLQMARRRRS